MDLLLRNPSSQPSFARPPQASTANGNRPQTASRSSSIKNRTDDKPKPTASSSFLTTDWPVAIKLFLNKCSHAANGAFVLLPRAPDHTTDRCELLVQIPSMPLVHPCGDATGFRQCLWCTPLDIRECLWCTLWTRDGHCFLPRRPPPPPHSPPTHPPPYHAHGQRGGVHI